MAFLFAVAALLVSLSNGALVYNVLEELPPGTPFGNIVMDSQLDQKYTDGDIAEMTFTFLSDPEEDARKGLFSIGETSGILETVDRLDRDTMCKYEDPCVISLDVAVGPAAFFQVLNLDIVIEDRNDHVPLFPQARLDLTIPESTPVGESFKLLVATDGDGAKFGIRRYELRPGVPELGLRQSADLDGSRELYLVILAALDRESVAGYQLQVIALDGGDPPQPGSMLLNISVSDANDNPPLFDNSIYLVHLAEDVEHPRMVVQVHAEDPDTGLAGTVAHYDFSSKTQELYGHVFSINQTTGEVFLTAALDFEDTTEYQLIVTASDAAMSSPKSSQVVLTVTVGDVNDNAPKITVNTLTVDGQPKVSESADVGSFVAHVSVTDRDNGHNGDIICVLDDGGANAFHMEEFRVTQYKVVTSRELDAETRNHYPITIECRDRGSPSLASSVNLLAMVTDSNDHAPIVAQPVYSATLQENNEVGLVLANVSATDGDATDKNNAISYYLVNNTRNLLSIDRDTGVVTASGQFDHEQERVVYTSIVATDNGEPSLSAEALMIVYVTDINDAAPSFLQAEYTFVIQENLEQVQTLDQVTATDADSPPFNQIRYSMTADPDSPQSTKLFQVDPESGEIQIPGPLDREASPMHKFKIIATDVEDPSLMGIVVVTIYVGDENDNSPRVDFPMGRNNTVQISNAHHVGDQVTRVYAHDLDSGNNGEVKYILVGGDSAGTFVLDPVTGDIIVASDLSGIKYRSFELSIVVSDHGNPPRNTSAVLNIVVNKSIAIVDTPYGQPQNPEGNKDGSILSGTNMTVLICMVSVSGVVAIILLAAIAFVLLRNRKAKATGSYANQRHDVNESMNQFNGEKFSDKSPSGDSSFPGSRLSPDGGDITKLWPRGGLSKSKGEDKTFYPNDLGTTTGYQSPEPTDSHMSHAANQSSDSGFEHGSDVMTNKSNGDTVVTLSPTAAFGTCADKKQLRAHRLMTFLSGEFDADSACSSEASNTDSGRDTLSDDVEAQRKDFADVHQGPGSSFKCSEEQHSPDGATTSPNGPLSYSQFSSQFNASQQSEENAQPKQTLRDVKAKDRSKKQQFWPAEYSPKKAPFCAIQSAPKSTDTGLQYNLKSGAINPYAPGYNFNDANSMLRYKMAGKQTAGSSADVTDDCMSQASTTSGSYVINLEDSMLNVVDITV